MAFNTIGTDELTAYGKDMELLTWSFAPQGAGAVGSNYSGVFLASVTRTGVGAFTLVFGGSGVSGKAFKAVLMADCVVRDNASVDRVATVVDPGVISGSTLTIKVQLKVGSTGAATDVAANAASWCRGSLLLKGYFGKDETGL